MARGLLLLLALLPALAAADPVDGLLAGDRLPSTRERLVAEACALPELSPERLAPLFDSDARTPPIDGARVANCRLDPALVPLMFSAFARSNLGTGASADPDVFERLLRGLQRFPPEVVRERLVQADHGAVVDAIHERFDGNWLQPIAGRSPLPRLDDAQRARIDAVVDAWVEGLLAPDGPGLLSLQTDSGGGLVRLQELLQYTLVDFVAEQGPEGARVAAEVRNQLPGEGPEDAMVAPAPDQVHPVTDPVPTDAPAGDWWRPPTSGRRSPALTLGLGVLVLLALWALALRRWPGSRAVLFPLGAVAVGLGALLATEGALALLGVRPPDAVRPAIDPNRVSGQHHAEAELEGRRHVVSTWGGHRYEAIPLPKPPGTLRIVALGESSVHGTHYLAEEAFPAVLERDLGDGAEVVNAGIGGALSDEVLRVGLTALGWEPDLLVLDYGYNDLTHIPYMVDYAGVDLRGLAVRRALGRWRLARALGELLPDREAAARLPVLGERSDDPAELAQRVEFAHQNAVANQRRLVLAARDAGVPVLLVVQPTNEDSCFAGRTPADGCYAAELAAITAEVAEATGAPVLDGAAMLRAAAAETGWSALFWDGVHPTRQGHALLGHALADGVRRTLSE